MNKDSAKHSLVSSGMIASKRFANVKLNPGIKAAAGNAG
jgi:hypothetical protein